MTRPSPTRPAPSGRPRGGFTLVELLVVFVVLAILIAILLPAIGAAMRAAKTGAASTEISQMAQALAQFKSTYHVYPPSKIVLSETGNYTPAYLKSQGDALLSRGDECVALGTRSVSYLKRIWPKMLLSTTGPLPALQVPAGGYDFNGDGVLPTPTNGALATGQIHILDGPECLVFFLGGLPGYEDGRATTTTGFAKNPANPAIAQTNTTLGANRSAPLFEFRPGRLVDNYPVRSAGVGNGFPEYTDGLDTGNPRPFVYFSSYEGAGYDPDDVNFAEEGELSTGSVVGATYNAAGVPTAGIGGRFFRSYTSTGPVASYAPNPYTNGPALKSTTTPNPEYVNKNTFQILSAGIDGQFGIGGTYRTTGEVLPFTTEFGAPNNLSQNIRQRERDNLTNFKGGQLD